MAPKNRPLAIPESARCRKQSGLVCWPFSRCRVADRDRCLKAKISGGNGGTPAKKLDARRLCPLPGSAIGRVDGHRRGNVGDGAVAGKQQQDGAPAAGGHRRQFVQMFTRPFAAGVGEQAEATTDVQGDALYLDQGVGGVAFAQGKIEARVAFADLAPEWPFQPRQPTSTERFGHQLVGALGVDDDLGAAAVDRQLPTTRQFALGVGYRLIPDFKAGFGTAGHGPGVGAVEGQRSAIGAHHIGKKSLIAAH